MYLILHFLMNITRNALTMITYDLLNTKLQSALSNGLPLAILRQDLEKELAKISDFMELFLERYGSRLTSNKEFTPEFRLYNKKSEEYNNVVRAIRNVDYFIGKQAA